MISLDSEFRAKIDWHEPKFNIHWMTPIIKGDYLYGIAGRHQEVPKYFAQALILVRPCGETEFHGKLNLPGPRIQS